MNFTLQLALVAGVACIMLATANSGGTAAGDVVAARATRKAAAGDPPEGPAGVPRPRPGGGGAGAGAGAGVVLTGDAWAPRLNRLSGTLDDGAGWARISGRAVEADGVLTIDWGISGLKASADCGRIAVAGTDADMLVQEVAAGFALAARESGRLGRPTCG